MKFWTRPEVDYREEKRQTEKKEKEREREREIGEMGKRGKREGVGVGGEFTVKTKGVEC